MNILLIENDPEIQTEIQTVLEEENHQVVLADTVVSAIQELDKKLSDTVIIDLELCKGSSFDLCQDLIKQQPSMPILILSLKNDTSVKVKCLNAGADDYLTKPFEPLELVARINAIARRYSSKNGASVVSRGELTVNKIDRTCTIQGSVIDLTNNELDLLVYLMEHAGTIISRYKLSKDIWDIDHHTPSNFVNVYISYLRKKIRPHTSYKYIKTVRSEGFVFREPKTTTNGAFNKNANKQHSAKLG